MTMAPSKEPTPAEAPTEEAEALTLGDLVELHDGRYALVVAANPVTVVPLGHPVPYELPARRVLG